MKNKSTKSRKGEISIEKKLKAYSLAAVSVLAVQPAVAAVVHTDIEPDTTFTATGNYMVDLNNDGTDDFTIWYSAGATTNNLRIQPVMGNEVLGSAGGAYFYPFALSLDDPISGSETEWNGIANGGYLTMAWLYTTGGSYGNWLGATDNYMALRFKVGSNWHYGWIRLDVKSDVSSITIKDYAYDDTPDAVILAGATGAAGITTPMLPDAITLFATNDVLTLDLKDVKLTEASITLMSINGQVVMSEKITDNSMQFNLQSLRSGIYMATIQSKEGLLSRKIFVE